MCRDASLIEFFINTVKVPTKGFIFIFYTGANLLDLRNDVPHNLFVFRDLLEVEERLNFVLFCEAGFVRSRGTT